METNDVLAAAGLGEPTDVLSIHISWEKLPDLDVFSKSDPVCHVYTKHSKQDKNWIKLGETEQISNNLNPEFVKWFELNYFFERDQMLKFEMYDVDVMSKEHIGDLEILVARVMGSHQQSFIGDLKLPGKPNSRGKIKIRLEQVSKSNDMVYFDAVAVNLPAKKVLWFGSDNPFIFIERTRSPDSDEFIRVIQTPHQSGTTNPKWNKLCFSIRKLSNGEINNRLKFKVFSYSKAGHHKAYGEFITSLAQLIRGEFQYDLYEIGTKVPIGRYFEFQNFMIEQRPSFYDFLHSGWEINLTVAIDFTASNGPPIYADSLHYLDPTGRPNQYQQVLHSVGGILQNYDTDKQIPAFGFGGIPLYSGQSQVSHCFHLNGAEQPECSELTGLMNAYNFSIGNVKLYGPTHFAPVVQTFIQYAQANISKPLYNILLIVTDGDIHDMDITKDLIVSGSTLPTSIIIVGVGDDEFQLMIELDGDEVILTNSKGHRTARDIVQFVKFNDFSHGGIELLAEEVLREVPEQVISYFTMNKIPLK